MIRLALPIALLCLLGTAHAEEAVTVDSVGDLYAAAERHLAAGNPLDAAASLEAVLRKVPRHAAARHALARVYQALGRPDRARSEQEAYLESMAWLLALNDALSPMDLHILERETALFLGDWRGSWEDRDLKAYLSFYAPDFQSQGMDLAAWRKRKESVFARSSAIQVGIRRLAVTRTAAGVSVRFVQEYRSSSFEETGPKEMLLAWRDNAWKIVREESR